MVQLILGMIDFFYPLFRRWMSPETFRYAACGGSNTLLGLLLYSFLYDRVLKGADLSLDFYAFKPHVASLFCSTAVTLPIGFLLNKYVVFSQSTVKGRVQLFRYLLLFVFCLFLNFVFLKFFVEVLFWNAIIAQVATTGIVILVSYLSQKHFTFKIEKRDQDFPF